MGAFDQVASPISNAQTQGAFSGVASPIANNDNSISENYIKPFIDTFKGGVQSAKDLLTNNYKSDEDAPGYQNLVNKMANQTATREDYEGMLAGAFSNSPGGKIANSLSIIPEVNAVSTALNKWINPLISKGTGMTPEEVGAAEMVVAPVAKIAGLGDNAAPVSSRIANVVTNPLQNAGNAIKTLSMPATAIARPLARGIIEGDNPITGEPGLKSSLTSDTANEGQRLADKMGIQFSAGELTGNKTAMGIEDALANSARYGGKFADAANAKTDAIVSKFNETLDQIHNSPVGAQQLGSRLSSAYNSTIDSLLQNRRSQAADDFSKVYEGTDNTPENQTIRTDNLFTTLQKLKDEGDARLLTASKAKGGELAGNLLNKLSALTKAGNEKPLPISIQELGNGLSDFSEAATRPSGTFDTADSAASRRVYSRLYGALQQDLDAEINNPQGDPARAAALKTARDNYNTNSDKIADLQKTTLGNIVGSADHDSNGQLVINPEDMAKKFSSMQPSELKSTLGFLDKNHPDVANMARRGVLESALNKAQDGQGLRGVGTTKSFGKAQFVQNLPSPEKLNTLLGDSAASDNVKDVAAAMNRLIDYGAQKSGSQTAQRTDFLNSLAKIGKGALYKSIINDSLADDLLDPSKRRQMAFEAKQSTK